MISSWHMVNTIAMKDFIYDIWSKFLTWFGKIKIATSGLIPVVFYKD